MIPTKKELKKKLKQYVIEKKNYFHLVEEYIQLQKKFEVQTFFETLFLYLDFLYPFYILYKIFTNTFHILDFLSIYKSYKIINDYIRYTELESEIERWIFIIKCLGGPWISTNDSKYHLYVYADAMTRLIEVSQKID